MVDLIYNIFMKRWHFRIENEYLDHVIYPKNNLYLKKPFYDYSIYKQA